MKESSKKELSETEEYLLISLKELVRKYKFEVLPALNYANNDVQFSIAWCRIENKNLVLQKLIKWVNEQEVNECRL
ncbi:MULTISPECIES: hypothetical protein [Listeria]|uniref:hypothetical protein n=1 Tax=Listeria TaxID=1637 RepID=UPI000B58B370|nr:MULTISPECIES: hypothetical protein [Listeria]